MTSEFLRIFRNFVHFKEC